jgi:DNA phosphorothioation-dependent restriction protein DptG
MPTRPSEIASKAAGKAKGIKAAIQGYRGIFRHLQEEHAEVSTLMKRVAAGEEPDIRAKLFPKIHSELMSHAKAEEKEFYPILRKHAALKELIDQSEEEHEEVEQLLGELTTCDPAQDDWGDLFEELMTSVEEHVELEEKELFVRAQDIIDDEQSKKMLERYEQAKKAEMQRLS